MTEKPLFGNSSADWGGTLFSRCFWYTIIPLLTLEYWLNSLQASHNYLRKLRFRLDEIFTSIRNPVAAASVLEELLPEIIKMYRSMVERNFPQMAKQFALYRLPNAPLLVEITHNPYGSTWASDFVEIRYVLLPSAVIPRQPVIYVREGQKSLAHTPFIKETLLGQRIEHIGSPFGQAGISIQVEEHNVVEPNAFVYRTKFPSRHPIADQVSQLIGSEVQYLLRGDFEDWHGIDSPSIDYEHLAWILSSSS